MAWLGMDWDDLRGSYEPVKARTEKAIRRAQTAAVRLTAGYLGAYLTSELGERVAAPKIRSQDYVGKSFGGLDLTESLQKPLISLLTANKQGKPDPMGVGLSALLVNVDLDVKQAARQALADTIEADDRVEGWQRAVRGTCGACAAAAVGLLGPTAAFKVHPNCQCVQEPLVSKAVEEPLEGDEAEDYLKEWQSRYVGELPPEVAGSLSHYQGDGYLSINKALRTDTVGLGGEVDEHVENLDYLMTAIGKPIKAFRGIGSRRPEEYGFVVGKTVTDRAFASLSTDESIGTNWAKTSVYAVIDPETKGAWVDGVLGVDFGEAELLLERGTRWVVERIDGREVYVRILPAK
jgi:hypothetical protein